MLHTKSLLQRVRRCANTVIWWACKQQLLCPCPWNQSNWTHPALYASSWCTFEETGGKDLRVGDKRLVRLTGGGALEWDWDWGLGPGPLGPGSVLVVVLSWRKRKKTKEPGWGSLQFVMGLIWKFTLKYLPRKQTVFFHETRILTLFFQLAFIKTGLNSCFYIRILCLTRITLYSI